MSTQETLQEAIERFYNAWQVMGVVVEGLKTDFVQEDIFDDNTKQRLVHVLPIATDEILDALRKVVAQIIFEEEMWQ